jgi:hypothetical protein
LTFKDLEVGDAFRFVNDARDDARELADPILREIRIVYRTKVSDWHYENTHADGDRSEGRVGVGDNPVVKVESHTGKHA